MVDSGPLATCYENVMASTKPEVLNVLQCLQMWTKPWPQATCTKNLVKISRIVFELCEQTDKQTNKQTYSSQKPTPLPGQNNNSVSCHFKTGSIDVVKDC